MKEISEEDLVRRLRGGDERSFKLIFDQYYRPLTVFTLKYVPDVDEAKEIVQESHFDNDTFTMEYVGGGFGLIASFFSQEDGNTISRDICFEEAKAR